MAPDARLVPPMPEIASHCPYWTCDKWMHSGCPPTSPFGHGLSSAFVVMAPGRIPSGRCQSTSQRPPGTGDLSPAERAALVTHLTRSINNWLSLRFDRDIAEPVVVHCVTLP